MQVLLTPATQTQSASSGRFLLARETDDGTSFQETFSRVFQGHETKAREDKRAENPVKDESPENEPASMAKEAVKTKPVQEPEEKTDAAADAQETEETPESEATAKLHARLQAMMAALTTLLAGKVPESTDAASAGPTDTGTETGTGTETATAAVNQNLIQELLEALDPKNGTNPGQVSARLKLLEAQLREELSKMAAQTESGSESLDSAFAAAVLRVRQAVGGAEEAPEKTLETVSAVKTAGAATTELPVNAATGVTGTGNATGQATSTATLTVVEKPPQPVTIEALHVSTVKNVQYLLTKGGQAISVRLVPEALGEMHIEVQARGNELTVRLTAASPMVREALESQLPALREALAKPGAPPAEIQVLAQAQTGFAQADQAKRGHAEPQPAPRNTKMVFAEGAGSERETGPPHALAGHNGALNVLV